jgi:flagellin
VKEGVDYKISSADSVKAALRMDDDDATGVKGFPQGAKVTVDDEYIYVSDDNGFEIKLYVNDRDKVTPVTGSVIDTKTEVVDSLTVKTYNKIDVTDVNGDKYIINQIISNNEDGIYSDAKSEGFTSLEEDLGIENITNVTLDATANTITVEYTDSEGNVKTPLVLTVDSGDIENSLYSTSTRAKIKYTVGDKDNPIKIDITKMGPMIVQTGANEGQYLEIEIPALKAINLGIDDFDVSTEDAATNAIDVAGKAINQLSTVRSKIGAYSNRLEHTITNLDTTVENMTESYSRIMDVDMAEEMTEYTSQQVLVQAATSVLAQANERPQQVLQLLQ